MGTSATNGEPSGDKFLFFREDLCDRCGLCFERCPVLELPANEAKREIKALIRGDTDRSLAFQLCTTCNTCDVICPKQANPYELVLERFSEWGKKHGLPSFAKLVFPNEPENIWSCTRTLMEPDEISLLHSWEDMAPRKVVLLTGFYTNLVPYIAQAEILQELRPAMAGCEGLGGCGGDSYKLGLFELTQQIARRLKQKFTQMGVERMYCFMGAEAIMLGDVLPRRFGVKFDFQVKPLDCWILDRLRSGKIKVKKKLSMRVTVHDNCCSKYMDGMLQGVTREILERIGCGVVEMRHTKELALCCGWAATIPTLYGPSSNNPLRTLGYLLYSLYRRLREAEATGAEALVVYCHACYEFLSLIKVLTNSKLPVYLSQELVQIAAGETPVHKNQKRAWDILAVATNYILRWVLFPRSRKSFFPKPVGVEMEPLPAPRGNDVRRIKLVAKLYHSPLLQNPISKHLIGAAFRAGLVMYGVFLESRKRRVISQKAFG